MKAIIAIALVSLLSSAATLRAELSADEARILALLLAKAQSSESNSAASEEAAKARHRQTVFHLAREAGEQVLAKMDGGQHLRTEVKEWTYHPGSDCYTIKMEVHWDGTIFASNHYEIDGNLLVNRNGSRPSFSQTWANENVKDYRGLRFGVGAAVVLGAIAAESNR